MQGKCPVCGESKVLDTVIHVQNSSIVGAEPDTGITEKDLTFELNVQAETKAIHICSGCFENDEHLHEGAKRRLDK